MTKSYLCHLSGNWVRWKKDRTCLLNLRPPYWLRSVSWWSVCPWLQAACCPRGVLLNLATVRSVKRRVIHGLSSDLIPCNLRIFDTEAQSIFDATQDTKHNAAQPPQGRIRDLVGGVWCHVSHSAHTCVCVCVCVCVSVCVCECGVKVTGVQRQSEREKVRQTDRQRVGRLLLSSRHVSHSCHFHPPP